MTKDIEVYCKTCDEEIVELDKMVKYSPGEYECIDCYTSKVDTVNEVNL